MDVSKSTVLVAGGASGLGAACARRLATGGARVIIADLNVASGEALAAELGGRARFAAVDVTSENDVQLAIDIARDAFGELRRGADRRPRSPARFGAV
jgi:NAD(P)-dependent dehydrogenase (short-subunit alcohol dehydrogenase family)